MVILNYRKESARDPDVIFNNGLFYCLYSYENALWIKYASSLDDLLDAAPRVVFKPNKKEEYSTRIWAPELHVIDGVCYIYVTIGAKSSLLEHMFVLTNDSDDPLKPYYIKSYIDNGDGGWAIDASIVKYNGSLYYVYSSFGKYDEEVYQALYIAKMKNPYTLESRSYLLSKSEFEWEKFGCDGGSRPYVNEGPFAIYHNEKIHIVYSASGCWTNHYCLGLLTFKGGDILNKDNWIKCSKPILDNRSGFIAPGHASFIQNHPSKKEYIFFHAYEVDCSRGEKYTLGHAYEISWENDKPIVNIDD